MTRWKITIEYNGTPYSGSQRQPDMPTVQGKIEEALYKFCQQKIDVVFAGRTDAGVHAYAQIVHFDLDYSFDTGEERSLSGFQLAKALNAHLTNEQIVIVNAQSVDKSFEARFDAKQKHYTYRIINRLHPLSLDKGLAWWIKKPLNIDAMKEAAKYLIGEHDFSSFRDSECQAKSPIRSIDEIYIEANAILNGQEIILHVKGQAFLHHQVRNIAGSLTYVGEGKWRSDDIKTVLEAKDRTKGGPTAPACGLFLQSIDYK